MPSRVRVTFDRVSAARGRIKELSRARVLVGIPSEKALRREEDGESIDVNNAMLGFIHENGSPAQNIPARPWLSTGIREGRDKIAAQLRRGVMSVLKGTDIGLSKTLHAVGLAAQNAVRKKLINGPFAPLSPVTIARRRARGRRGTRPLNDTAQMRNAVTYVIDGE